MNTSTKVQQNFDNIQLELDTNKILFGQNNKGVIVYEEFKDIPGYKGFYKVSDFGRVKSLQREVKSKANSNRKVKERILKPSIDVNGYLTVSLQKYRKVKTTRLHIIVAISFLGHTPNGQNIVVDHIDNIKTNNRLYNLQLITNRENTSKDRKNGTSKYTGVHYNKVQEKWISSINSRSKTLNLGTFTSELEASEYYKNALKSIENGEEIKVKRRFKTSRYKGVGWCKIMSKWRIRKYRNGKYLFIEYFNDEFEAHLAYQHKIKSLKNV